MNENSYLCRYLSAHPYDWEDSLKKEYGLRIKKDGDYAIFNYEITADFYDPIVQEARGIILDTARCEVVCWPFRKFGNYSEGYADGIDWSTARVFEKIDGSIIKLWYDEKKEGWQFSTNRTIRAELAGVEGEPLITYGKLIEEAENYQMIPWDRLDRRLTYIFELVSPRARVVIAYERTYLYHLGTRHTLTGQELDVDIGIAKPMAYPLSSLEDCVNAATLLNRGASGEGVEREGFVVVDAAYRRVKVKSVDYIMMHRVSSMKTIGRHECLHMLLNNEGQLRELLTRPSLVPVIRYYEYRLAELLYQADIMGEFTLKLYEEYSRDRAAVARIISKHSLGFIGFLCLDRGVTGRQALLSVPLEKWMARIPEYCGDDLLGELMARVKEG